MPLYEYSCKHCRSREERSRPVAARRDTFRCDHCEAECAMVLVPSLTAFALKGDGWTPNGPMGTPTHATPRHRPAGYDMTGERND